jgi:3-deoxy-manno-octulosonate cytidylyltransferase (CMP-KDO synthetase)
VSAQEFTVIIPARYASERLPGKALLDIAGKPMIQHVFERSAASSAARVVVATDDKRIADVVDGFGGQVCMTSPAHPSGTDRLQEAANRLGLGDEALVVNVQGDEPLIPPAVIDQVAANLAGASARMATLFEPIDSWEDVVDPSIVKVVCDSRGRAMYFSRAPIPFDRSERRATDEVTYKRHLGIYAYRVSLLNEFVRWTPGPLETAERLEQLRALWHGVEIHIDRAVVAIPPGIDTQRDLERTRELLEQGG